MLMLMFILMVIVTMMIMVVLKIILMKSPGVGCMTHPWPKITMSGRPIATIVITSATIVHESFSEQFGFMLSVGQINTIDAFLQNFIDNHTNH